jgi:hypothetical protein
VSDVVLGTQELREQGPVAHYETLRVSAEDARSPFRWGRAVLMQRGMAAWLEVFSTCVTSAPAERMRTGQSVEVLLIFA